jgi:transcriptional regulator with XRE-family HTH domain
MTAITKAFGLAIQERRHEVSFSQEDLAFRAGVHRTYISQLERGIKSPTLKVIVSLAVALDCPASQLILRAEEFARDIAK